jgi:hypothetical protein
VLALEETQRCHSVLAIERTGQAEYFYHAARL